MATRAPKGEVVHNPVRGGFTYALRFTANGKRHYVTLGRPKDGWTEKRAQDELQSTLAAVRAGTWKPWEPAPEPQEDPSFHEFASQWFEDTKDEWRENTRLDYYWQLRFHLLPFFKDHRLAQITVAEVDRYRNSKLAENRVIRAAAAKGKPRMQEYTDKRGRRCKRPERPLSAASINKTITRLGQILEVAVERELIARNPAKIGGKRRRAKASKPQRAYLDRAEQITALLDAASRMDAEARVTGRIARRALLATLTLAGLRISEALELRWREVDLAAGRLRVRQSKTDAGARYVDLLPPLRDELASLRAALGANIDPATLVFPSATGTRQDRNRVRNRILAVAVKRANAQLLEDGFAPLPEGLTLHALRRTCASLLVATGRDPSYVMGQMGHTDPSVTLGIYAQVMQASDEDRGRLRALVEGDYLAVAGSGELDGSGSAPVKAAAEASETAD
jgi:integrase